MTHPAPLPSALPSTQPSPQPVTQPVTQPITPPTRPPRQLWRNARLATLAGASGWGLIEHGALLTEGDALRWVGAEADLPAGLPTDAEHDVHGALITPGLVDCHTHLV